MADWFFGLDKGETAKDVTEGTSSTATTDCELRITSEVVGGRKLTRLDVKVLLEHLLVAVEKGTWPRA